ncbi:MAG: photosynthetic complex assembly protein PuhC [Gammaproteobacteria bacterium]|jgi:putative photosynthetic complex assembly protein|nr:photosynthetic complex assembly protein PuhC [Gammaproteobacteria bacterium]
MSAHHAQQGLPRSVLFSAGALVLFALVAAALSRNTDVGASRVATPEVVGQVRVRFADGSDGSVMVMDADSDALVVRLEPGTNGFVRGVMRGLARERRQNEVGQNAAFEIAKTATGALLLFDPETGRRIDLQAFGPVNMEAFAGIYRAASQP